MNTKLAFGLTTLMCLGLSSAIEAQTAIPAPQKHSLALPATATPASGQPAPSIECVITFGPSVPISALAFSPDGNLLAVGGYQDVSLWDLANAALSKRVGVGQIGDFVHALAFSKDGRSLVVAEGTAYGAGAVRILDIETGQVTVTFQEPKDVVYSLALSPDGNLLAAGGADALVHVWNMDENKLVGAMEESTVRGGLLDSFERIRSLCGMKYVLDSFHANPGAIIASVQFFGPLNVPNRIRHDISLKEKMALKPERHNVKRKSVDQIGRAHVLKLGSFFSISICPARSTLPSIKNPVSPSEMRSSKR